jgi:DNA (cytosine-5)-methyltransferase 1
MKIGSVFSGGGGGDLGFKSSGHQITFGCEINEYARSVLRKHNPDLIIYNDIKEITLERLLADGAEIPEVIFGGSPCQDLSVAGYREGLGGERSGLFTEQCRVADEISAPWIVWENVVGAFSSNKGRDFAEVLYYTTGFRPEVPKGGWKSGGVCIGPKRSAVWRVLDAQAFGVPQRRRRIFLIAGPRELASRIIDVLFEPESSERNSTEGRKTGQEVAGETQERIGTSSVGALTEISQSILARYGSRGDLETETFIVEKVWSGSTHKEDLAATLTDPAGGQRTTNIDGASWVVYDTKPYVAFDSNYSGQYSIVNNGDISPTIKLGSNLNGQPPAIGCGDIVRRLTPLECERLMGWPDNYTKVGLADNCSDVNISNSQRYRICGNGIVSNVTYWIGNQLNKVLNV